MFDYVLFDLDGTLVDTFDGIAEGVRYALEKMGVQDVGLAGASAFIGPPLTQSFGITFDGDKEKVMRAIDFFQEYYGTDGWARNSVYAGIAEMLQTLKDSGKHLFVATSKPERFAVPVLEANGLYKYFEFVSAAESEEVRSTKSEVIQYALACAHIPIDRAVMVGDRKYDVVGAKAHGLKSIGVLYGFGDRDELADAGADYIVGEPRDIVAIVCEK